MCDTLVVLADQSGKGCNYLAKNSDREPDEAQAISCKPKMNHQEAFVECTYIKIPQVKRTNSIIISRPFQMWGAEMGVNEYGVAIGNEAVFTKFKFAKNNNGLTGMDMVRLALERSSTAMEALQTITDLLEQYGQNACGGYRNNNFYYHNSFLILDRTSAWKLETAGSEWAAKPIEKNDSISNALSIHTDWKLKSQNAITTARRKAWLKRSKGIFSFKKSYSDFIYTFFSNSKKRRAQSQECLEKSTDFTKLTAFQFLKSHHPRNKKFHPKKASSASICMHATGKLNPSSTTGSMVAEICTGCKPIVWLTCTAYPCLSVYIPFYFNELEKCSSLDRWLDADGENQGIWWLHKKLYTLVLKNYRQYNPWLVKEIAEFQHEVLGNYKNAGIGKLEDTVQWLRRYEELLHQWIKQLTAELNT